MAQLIKQVRTAKDALSSETKLAEAVELQGYYQQMAEDYRAKYANLEREFNYLKHTHEYDLQKLRQDRMNVEGQLTERIMFEQSEVQGRMQKEMQEKDE